MQLTREVVEEVARVHGLHQVKPESRGERALHVLALLELLQPLQRGVRRRDQPYLLQQRHQRRIALLDGLLVFLAKALDVLRPVPDPGLRTGALSASGERSDLSVFLPLFTTA